MKNWMTWCLAGCLAHILWLGAGCQQEPAAPAPNREQPVPTAESNGASPPRALDLDLPTQAQPQLPTVKLWLGAAELEAEVARSPRQLQTGMMFRNELPDHQAMLFVFPTPRQVGFWMKNVDIPLSAAYINTQGVIQEIVRLDPQDTNTVKSATENIQFVLETSQGWFDRHQVSTGAVLRTEYGTLFHTFFTRSGWKEQ